MNWLWTNYFTLSDTKFLVDLKKWCFAMYRTESMFTTFPIQIYLPICWLNDATNWALAMSHTIRFPPPSPAKRIWSRQHKHLHDKRKDEKVNDKSNWITSRRLPPRNTISWTATLQGLNKYQIVSYFKVEYDSHTGYIQTKYKSIKDE